MTGTVVGYLAAAGLALAALPAILTLANLRVLRRAVLPTSGRLPPVSVLVPARDEEAAIERLCRDVLAATDVALELVVLDDDSRDRTAEIVAAAAAVDPRVRLVRGVPLPVGWCGKQHACWQLSRAARHDVWVFLDVDVSLAPDAIARAVTQLETAEVALVSGFPRQETGAFLDWLLLPLIHFILLGFLPLARARSDGRPGLAAGCGQLFVTRRSDYARAGGHAVIRQSLHDGIMLPRAYRRAGLKTDIFDASDIASCRMYGGSRATWHGLAKNATEGVGSPGTILPFTVLLAGGQVLPVALVLAGLVTGWRGWPAWAIACGVAAVAASYLPRLLEAARFRQPVASAIAHPLAVVVFLVIQWLALVRRSLGFQTAWRGRRLAPP